MSPFWTFLFGLGLLALFAWYFFTDSDRRKRWLGTALGVLLVAFCIGEVIPLKSIPANPETGQPEIVGKLKLGLDLEGGSSFLIRLVREGDKEIGPDTQGQAVEVIRKRVDQFGVGEPVITPQGTDRILVQIPGLDPAGIAQAREQLQKVAKLEFKLVHPQSDQILDAAERGEGIIPPDFRVETYKDEVQGKEIESKILVKKSADLDGSVVQGAHAFYDQRGYGVALNFDSKGADLFGKLTQANVGERFAIVLDGEVQSAPVIQEPIHGGQATITGRFSEEEARNLASVLENPLSTPVAIEEERNVSATLGHDSIRSGVIAGLLGLGLTVVSVLLYYHIPGIIAIIGLTVNVILLFGLMAMFNFVLTLPGIAGIILTIGMAVDANVLIYERLREELQAGKSLSAAVQGAYSKAFSAIFDSNATTLITSAILFWQASGSVKGFAVTLTVGIIASLFAALLVTRNCFAWATSRFGLKRITMLDLSPKRIFDFMGKRRICAWISIAVLLGSIGFFALRGKKNFGIDFLGGDLLTLTATSSVQEADARKALGEIGRADSVIQRETVLDKEVLTIRSPEGTGDQIASHLKAAFPEAGIEQTGLDRVGPVVGKELARGSLVALTLALFGILIYVSLRFEFSFALGALVALFHDVIITIGVLSILGRELNLIMVGAILTIAGYSINDTIVVFDRIREGLQAGAKGSIGEIMNRSINETLSRTILTGGTTLLSVAALYFFGGPVLREFALAILIGVLVGTYSSIFIASPVVLWWSQRKGGSLMHEVRRSQAEATPA